MHPDYPVVTGEYQMTKEWWVVLPEKFNRRVEEGDLVLWRPALTFWMVVWGNDSNATTDQRLSSILSSASELRSDQQVDDSNGLIRLTYPNTNRSQAM